MGAEEREAALRLELEETAARLRDAQAALELRTAYVKEFDAEVTEAHGAVRQLERLKLNMEERLASSSDQIEDIKVPDGRADARAPGAPAPRRARPAR